MARLVALVAALVTSACCTSLPGTRGTKKLSLPETPARYEVETESLVWSDTARNREVPAKIYSPAGTTGRLPLVVVSHGIGEDRESYEYLGRALARRGFIAVHLTHAGTDRAVLERGYIELYRSVKKKENWQARVLDASFAIDQMTARTNVETSQIAVVGHSAGAWTAFALAGMLPASGESLADRRVKVAIPMSMPRMDGIVPPDGYDAIAIPVLNITGTCDTSIIYRTFPRHRRIPFDSTKAVRQYLVTIEGVTHDTFSKLADPFHPLLERLTIAFLRAHLLDDAVARAWFDEPGREDTPGAPLTVENK